MVEYTVAEERSDPHRPIGEPTGTDFSQTNNYYYLNYYFIKKSLSVSTFPITLWAPKGWKWLQEENSWCEITGKEIPFAKLSNSMFLLLVFARLDSVTNPR